MNLYFKIILTFIGFVITSINCHSQTYFNKRYDIRNNYDNGLSIVANDSGYVVCSGSNNNGNIGVGLISLDIFGDTLYSKWYGKNMTGYYCGWGGSFKKEFSNGYYLGGSYEDTATGLISFGLLMRIDNNLDTVWVKKYGDSIEDHIFYQARQTSDSGFICVGSMYNGSSVQVLLIKTDNLGNELWRKNYGGSNTEIGTTVMQTSDGGYLIGGVNNSLSCNGGYDQWVGKTDSAGNLQWSRCYGNNYDDGNAILGHQYPDGDYVFVGYHSNNAAGWYQKRITRIKSNNVIEWDQPIGGHNSNNALHSLKVLSDGSIVAVGVDFFDGTVIRMNENGDSIYNRQFSYPSSIYNELWDFDIATDGGIVAVGTTNDGSQDIWLLKLDKFGCLEPDCWISEYESKPLNITGIEEMNPVKSFELFPNPNNGAFSIQYEIASASYPIYLSFYDATGRKVYEKALQPGILKHQINLKLSDGIYKWNLVYDNIQLNTGKFIIIK